jgi:hypothetical protein
MPTITARTNSACTPYVSAPPVASLRNALLACGIAGGALYPIADIIASTRYPGFSYRDMAVSELFAIGAPTSALVVTLFSVSSTLVLLFAVGTWMSAGNRRIVRWIAALMALNAIDALTLWNFFPMHMRGVERTLTDTMHGLLAIDPFLLAAMILAAIAWPGWFRRYTIGSLTFSTLLVIIGIRSIAAFMANEPTPWMGASERAGQYATNVWYGVMAVMLMRRRA